MSEFIGRISDLAVALDNRVRAVPLRPLLLIWSLTLFLSQTVQKEELSDEKEILVRWYLTRKVHMVWKSLQNSETISTLLFDVGAFKVWSPQWCLVRDPLNSLDQLRPFWFLCWFYIKNSLKRRWFHSSPPKCVTQQYTIEECFLQKWATPVVHPGVSYLKKIPHVPMEDNPLFKDLVEKRLKALLKAKFALVDSAIQPAVLSMFVRPLLHDMAYGLESQLHLYRSLCA